MKNKAVKIGITSLVLANTAARIGTVQSWTDRIALVREADLLKTMDVLYRRTDEIASIAQEVREIEGVDAGWGRFYGANVSVKRAFAERVQRLGPGRERPDFWADAGRPSARQQLVGDDGKREHIRFSGPARSGDPRWRAIRADGGRKRDDDADEAPALPQVPRRVLRARAPGCLPRP